MAAYTKNGMMLVDCITKPVNGSHFFRQISYAIGVRFYPDPSMQYFVDLALDTFSWHYHFLHASTKSSG
jgi:hypothetical protein